MIAHFQVKFRKSNGNLHVHPRGDFDGNSASELIRRIHEHYNGKGRVFIDTHCLGKMHPSGCSMFQCRLDQNRLPLDRLFFKGKKGLEIAPQGSRVIMPSEESRCRCKGRCANCPCGKESALD